MAPPKALENIGKTLHSRYECWQPKVTKLPICLTLSYFWKSLFATECPKCCHLQARYKLQLDPTVEEVKKLCNTCRKYARSERVIFHYNGHGVPKPTANGEIWVFNKVNVVKALFCFCIYLRCLWRNDLLCILLQSYTQYIPLPITDLDSWLKTPSIYVFDCSAAGIIVKAFLEVCYMLLTNVFFLLCLKLKVSHDLYFTLFLFLASCII